MNTDHDFRRFFCGNCPHWIDVPVSCGDRFCGVCQGVSRRRARARLSAILESSPKKSGYRWRFVTLTQPSTNDLTAGLTALLVQFRRLRQRVWWKRQVWGGAYVVEITKSKELWHIHIHALVYSSYLPQFQLAKVWKACGPGLIVHIRLIRGNADAIYLTKYLTKSSVPTEDRAELAAALRGKRLFSPFGAAHDVNVSIEKVSFKCPHCDHSLWIPETEVNRWLTG